MTAGVASHRQRRRYRTDWFRVLVQLQYLGYPHARVATTLAVPLGTVKGWKYGSEPPHEHGHALLELWAEVTLQQVNERPMTRD